MFLSNDALIGNDTFLSTHAFTGSIAAGSSLDQQAEISLPPFIAGDFYLIVRTNANNPVFELDQVNDIQIDDQPIHVAGSLRLSLSRTTVTENSGSAAAIATLTRNGTTAENLVVDLSSSDPSSLAVPTSVTIPAGQSSVQFPIDAVDNLAVDGSRPVTITATSSGFADGVATCTVTDNDVPTLSLDIFADSFAENDANPVTTAAVTRNTDTSDELVVQLLSDNITKLTVPATVTIPAGQSSVTFPITAVDNTVLDGTARVNITASAMGFATGSDHVDVTDDDTVNLSLSFASNAITEGSSSPATTGTVTRSVVTSEPLRVTLSSTNSSAISIPTQVTIPANQASASFVVNAPDDTLALGTQIVLVSAQLTTTLGVVLDVGAATAGLQVLDNDGPTLTVTTPSAALREGTTRHRICNPQHRDYR